MNSKNKKIIELLRLGKPYSYIQTVVEVSPSKIAKLKKLLDSGSEIIDDSFEENLSTTTSLPSTTIDNTDGSETTTKKVVSQKSSNQVNYEPKNQKKMETNNNSENKISLEVEKLRILMEQKIALKKIKMEKDELNLKRWELQLKEKQVGSEERKVEKQGKTLIFQIVSLAKKMKDGEWKCKIIDNYYKKFLELREDMEQYCFENDIETEGLKIMSFIELMQQEFDGIELEEDWEDDDTIDITFSEEFHEQLKLAKEMDFDTYE